MTAIYIIGIANNVDILWAIKIPFAIMYYISKYTLDGYYGPNT